MDNCEATKTVMSRIQNIDPENASKIMGYILIQDQGEKEMIRLAFGPEALLVSLVKQAKAFLGLSWNPSSAPSTPSSPSPFTPISSHPFPQSSPRILIPNNGFHLNPPSSPSSPWSVSGFSGSPSGHMSPRPASALSYAAVVNGGSNPSGDFSDEYKSIQLDQTCVHDDESKNVDFTDPIVSPSGGSDSFLFPYAANNHNLHRRSCSVNDAFLGNGGSVSEDGGCGGFGWRPCMYYLRGFCKNGNTCKFVHGGLTLTDPPDSAIVGSPNQVDSFEDLLRMKAIQQQRLAAMAGGGNFLYNRGVNFLDENQRSAAAAALMMGEDVHKFGRCRLERGEFSLFRFVGNSNSSARQIYLTFPADSTFKEEDVSKYFSMFGPVQDVRIPYQQKRMFGFVTFVYPETVKQILAKGNPHFVCDSRVLVKPYKEKGKVTEKKQHLMERGEFSGCLSPTILDSAEPFDHIPYGARVFHNAQEMMLRRKLEERAELQQAIEYQGRRMMNFHLGELNNPHRNHQLDPELAVHALNYSVPSPSPTQPHYENALLPSDGSSQVPGEAIDYGTEGADQKVPHDTDSNDSGGAAIADAEEGTTNLDDTDFNGSLEHILPDNLFASPKKSAGNHHHSDSVASSAALNISSQKSCYFQMPRFSSGQEAIEM